MGPILFSIFTRNLDNRAKHTLNKFADDTELAGVVDTLVVCAAIQGDLGSLEKWVNRNLMKFTKGKIPHLWRSSTIHWLTSGFKENSLASR